MVRSAAAEVVEPGGEGLVEFGEEVAVALEGDSDGGVAEAFLDGLGVGAEGDAEGSAGVPQVVETGAVGEPSAADGYTTPAAFEAEWHETNKRATLSCPESSAGDPGDTNHPSKSVAQPATTQTTEPL